METRPYARRDVLKAAVVVALALCLAPSISRANTCVPPDAAAAEAFVQNLHEGARKILVRAKNPVADMVAFISKNVEIEQVAQYAMGPAWNAATPEQRTAYVKLFRTTTLRTLASHITLYDGAAYKVVQARSMGNGEYLVTSTVTPQAGRSFGLAWRVSARGCKLTASDVVNSGVSLVVTKRQEFASVIAREGVDGLVQRLRVLAGNQRKGVAADEDSGEEVLMDLVLRAAEKLGSSRY